MINMNVGNEFNMVIHEHLKDFSLSQNVYTELERTHRHLAGKGERLSIVAIRAAELILATDRMVTA